MSDRWREHDGSGYPSEGQVIRVKLRDGSVPHLPMIGNWCWSLFRKHENDVVQYVLHGDQRVASCEAVAQQYLQRTDVLDAARQAVTIDRAATHGSVEDNFNRIAAIWSVHLGVPVTGAQVALMLAELKVVRAWGNPTHADNWCDLAGYAACGGELSRAVKP